MLHDAKAEIDITLYGFCVKDWQIFWYSHPCRRDICYVTFVNRNKGNMEHFARRLFMLF